MFSLWWKLDNRTSSQLRFSPLSYFCFETEMKIIIKIQLECNAISEYSFVGKVSVIGRNHTMCWESCDIYLTPAVFRGSHNPFVLVQVNFCNLAIVTFLSSKRWIVADGEDYIGNHIYQKCADIPKNSKAKLRGSKYSWCCAWPWLPRG